MLGISPKNLDVLLKYLGGLHSHLWKQVMLFKPRTIDEACVQAQYLENIGNKKGQPSGSKIEIPPRCFQGGEEEVERKKQEDNNHYTSVQGSKQPLQPL
jgi:hypothetical protein